MEIKTFVFNPFYENTLIVSSQKGSALIVDPGCYEDYEVEQVMSYIRTHDLKITGILNTHCHIDHVLGNKELKHRLQTTLRIPINEQVVFDAVTARAAQWGVADYQEAEIDGYMKEGEEIKLDELTFKILEVPGHSPGHQMFYEESQKVIIGGDVLFKESIGRTDLPGGNHADLIQNIQTKVYTLPEDVVVYPGHGPSTTIGHEKSHNPFVRA